MDARTVTSLLLHRVVHRLHRVEVLLDLPHLHGESPYVYFLIFIYFNSFVSLQRDKKDGVPKRLDRVLRKLESDHNKRSALVRELGALPSVVAPG